MEEVVEDRKRAAVLRMFLDSAGVLYKQFKNDEERLNAIQWFNDNFQWREAYNGDVEAAANDMVAAYMGIEQSNVDTETKKQAEFGSERVAGKRPKQDERMPEKPEKPKAKKQKQTGAVSSAVVPSNVVAGSSSVDTSNVEAASSSVVPSNVEPSHRAMSALVTSLHSFVESSAEEQRVFMEKLVRE